MSKVEKNVLHWMQQQPEYLCFDFEELQEVFTQLCFAERVRK
jgi:hypothetical protein